MIYTSFLRSMLITNNQSDTYSNEIDYIYFKAFCTPTKCLKQLKLASTMVDVLRKTLFLFWWANLRHSCLKTTISKIEFSYHQLIHQFCLLFISSPPFFCHIRFKKKHFRNSKYFYVSRFNFQNINFEFTAVDLIFKT